MNDKEGRKWLLQKLYDNGFKYIFHSGGIGGYIATKQQPKFENDRTYIEGSFERIDVLSDLIPDFNEPNYLDIGKYLGVFDWSKVVVDTPIIVSEWFSVEVRRYFKEYKDGKVYYFSGGRTSWSSMSSEYTTPDKVRLAGGDDEN
jgi:hypothetical protein